MRKLFRAAALAAALAFAGRADNLFAFKPTVSVSVGTSATSLAGDARHTFVLLCNVDTSKTLYWSFSSAVTTANGTPLLPGSPCLPFANLVQGQLLYGVTTSGTIDVRVTEGFRQ